MGGFVPIIIIAVIFSIIRAANKMVKQQGAGQHPIQPDTVPAAQKSVNVPRIEQTLPTVQKVPQHRMQDHPAFRDSSAYEQAGVGDVSLGVEFTGEGCAPEHAVRPVWQDTAAKADKSAALFNNKEELVRGIILSEILGPRGGKNKINRPYGQ